MADVAKFCVVDNGGLIRSDGRYDTFAEAKARCQSQWDGSAKTPGDQWLIVLAYETVTE